MRKQVLNLVLLLPAVLAFFTFLMTHGSEGSQGEGIEAAPLACSPDRPTVLPDERVTLGAWAFASNPESLKYTWSINAGKLTGSGAEVTWDFTGVDPGTYEATVAVTLPDGKEARCSLSMLVIPTETKGVETGWSLLRSGRREEAGYGLYSYLLFGSRPATAETRDRHLKALEAYVTLAESVQSLERAGKPRRELNVTYAPVLRLPQKDRPTPEWLLENYDFARARVILSSFPGDYRDGPYIISVLRPLGGNMFSGNYLYQNLSAVPPRIVLAWAKAFMNQAAKERFWEEQTSQKLARNLRTIVAQLADGYPMVIKALNELIALKSTLKL